ncbi:MAG: ATP-binding cassette domain-containing protein [Nannocystaceae bacterium]
MLTATGVTKSYGGKLLFDSVTTSFEPGHRYGLTGANGAGKSTFMKILAEELEPDEGSISRLPNSRLSVLHQDHGRFAANRIRDVVVMGNKRLWAAMEEKERLLASGKMDDETGMKLGELEVAIGEENGYEAEHEAEQILSGLGIAVELHEQPLSMLTGGMRLRTLVAQALFGRPDILLLDEPTNHLDLESVTWLERFLYDYTGVLIVISHDRHFLNSVCTHTADVDYENIIVYPGAYDQMLQQKVQYRISEEKHNHSKSKKINELKHFISRFGANAKKASQAQSRRRQLDKIKVSMTDLKRSNIQRPFIRFEQKKQGGKIALKVEHVCKSFDGHDVLNDLTFTLQRGDKLAVVGPNGIGKSTLLKTIAGVYKADRGQVVPGHEATAGYMPQEHEDALVGAEGKTAYEWLSQWDEKATVEEIRGLLGRMLFPSQDADKQVSALSGGETARLLMSKLTLTKDNVLVLDEPTNHLDLESIRSLTEALQKFDGTLIIVCHDHYALSDVATCVLELKANAAYDFFPGDYEDFLVKTGKGGTGKTG